MAYQTGRVWTFKTGRFVVALDIDLEDGYRYDGDDEDGEVQAKLDAGEYVALESAVHVYLDGAKIGSDYLGGSVYAWDEMSDFWTSHRTSAPEYRNTLDQKALGRCIGHYFPGMVHQAIGEARDWIKRNRLAA